MAATIEERADSPQIVYGENPSARVTYVIRGTEDISEARDLVIATPDTLETEDAVELIRRSATMEPKGPDIWESVVLFGPGAGQPDGESLPQNFSLRLTGAAHRVTQSIMTVASYAPPGKTPPDYKGAIGVTDHGIEGVDIGEEGPSFVEHYKIDRLFFTRSYVRTLIELRNTVNDGAFRGFGPCEVLFKGVDAEIDSTKNYVDVSFYFAMSLSIEDMAISGIAGAVPKRGWEYLWIRYSDETDNAAAALVRTPESVHVEQVFHYQDFSLLGIGVA